MKSHSELKLQAVKLRKDGNSYSEILKRVPVAKSTLSLWLRDVGLAQRQRQRLTQKKLDGARRGALRRRETRLLAVETIYENACSEVRSLSKKEVWLVGVALYWAEGAKEKLEAHSTTFKFSNSDPLMHTFMQQWLRVHCVVPSKEWRYEIYLPTNGDKEKSVTFWKKHLNCSKSQVRVYSKPKNSYASKRKYGKTYHGLLRLCVPRTTDLVRKIAGWSHGIARSGVV